LAGGVDLVRFTQSLAAAGSLEQLERAFMAGFPSVIPARIYGYNLFDPVTGANTWFAHANISDTFIARYQHEARAVDPMRAQAFADGKVAYNRSLMSADEWEESVVYRRAYRLHGIEHVVEVPLTMWGRVCGNLHFGDSEHDYGPDEVALATAIGAVIAQTVEGLDVRRGLERERDHALAALELTGTPVVTTSPAETEPRLNDAARRLLAEVVDGGGRLYQLLARPAINGPFSRRLEVRLASGEAAVVHGHSSPVAAPDGGLVVVLELEREQPGLAPGPLAALTPREQEVAVLVVDGLADREIAERLCLSHHTVTQYVKRIYRKIEVNSRVSLTRVLLGSGRARR
jgi:DNA-binding CsgD family transcriptional regulator